MYVFRRFRETCVHVDSSLTPPVPLVDKRGILPYPPTPFKLSTWYMDGPKASQSFSSSIIR